MPDEDMPKGLSRKVAMEDVRAPHSTGFNAALDQALLAASELGRGSFTVSVEFWAEIEVTNPGQIQQYGVTLTPRG